MAQVQDTLHFIRHQYESLSNALSAYTSSLPEYAARAVDNRLREIENEEELIRSIGLPIRRREDVPAAFAVPVTVKPVVLKPTVQVDSQGERWEVRDDTYQDILRTLYELGLGFERVPKSFADRAEENLRDLLLIYLSMRYRNEASVTEEAFNCEGKTDILIKHLNRNVFIAECKFWDGPERHHDTIDQILRYLTWRDGKAAIIYFVNKQSMRSAIKGINDHTHTHPCFDSFAGNEEESWFSFKFRHPGEETAAVKLAVLCFHFRPESIKRKRGE